MSSFFRDVFRVGFSNVLIIVFGITTSIITARFLGPEKNGIIAALLVYPGLFMSVGSLGIRQSTTYFLGKNIYTEDQIKVAVTQIWFFTSITSLIICFVLMKEFSNSGEHLIWILLALAPLPFSLFNTYNSGIFLGRNDITTFNKISWIPALVTTLGTAIFVIGMSLEVSGVLLAAVVGPVLMATILLYKNKFIQSFKLKFDWSIIRAMLSLGLVYAFALLIINLNYRVDIIILDKLSTPYELGIYSKGAGITQYLWQIPTVLSTIVFARSAVSKDNKLFSLKVAQLLRLSFVAVGLLAIVFIIFAPFVIITMYGQEFFDSIKVLQILLPGVIVLTIFKVMNMDLAGKGKPWISMKAMVPALIINVVLNLLLIPSLGAIGASISSTVSYSVAGLLFLAFYSKATGLSIKEIVSYRRADVEPIVSFIKKIK